MTLSWRSVGRTNSMLGTRQHCHVSWEAPYSHVHRVFASISSPVSAPYIGGTTHGTLVALLATRPVMRLIDTETGQFHVVSNEFQVPYAILSHTWDPQGEQTFQDVCEIQTSVWKGETRKTVLRWFRYLLQLAVAKYTAVSVADQSRMEKLKMMFIYRLLTWTKRLLALVNKLQPDEPPSKSILSDPRLAEKIRRTCIVAREAGYRWVWIDSCCIDKTSSSELSEAINSMYVWYKHAAVCFVILPDVSPQDALAAPGSEFRRSRWFTRGWTLQELIAPHVVVFLSGDWEPIGTKSTLATTLAEITRIPAAVFNHVQDVKDASVAQRMSWASQRVTTREEDEAYSLMGIFGVNMPALYGEGRYAFIRLQEEILKQEYDQSLFAWSRFDRANEKGDSQVPRFQHLRPSPNGGIHVGPLVVQNPGSMGIIDAEAVTAISPADFSACANIITLTPRQLQDRLGMPVPSPTYSPTPFGVSVHLPLIPFDGQMLPDAAQADVALVGKREWFLAVLACAATIPGSDGHLLAFICSLPLPPERGGIKATCERNQNRIPILAGGIYDTDAPGGQRNRLRTVMLSLTDIAGLRHTIRVEEVFIPMRPSRETMAASFKLGRALRSRQSEAPALGVRGDKEPVCEIAAAIRLAAWCRSLLRTQGFSISDVPTTTPTGRFAITTEAGAGIVVECRPNVRIEVHGAAVAQVRIVRVENIEDVQQLDENSGEWVAVGEGAPKVVPVRTGLRTAPLRKVHLSLRHHSPDTYLLGIEPVYSPSRTDL